MKPEGPRKPRPRRVRKRWLVLLLLAALLAASPALYRRLASGPLREEARQRAIRAIEDASGLRAEVGSLGFGILPPRVWARDLRLLDGDRVLAEVPRARVRLRITSLLSGSAEIAGIVLFEPRVSVERADLERLRRRRAAAARGADAGPPAGALEIQDARVEVRDPSSGLVLAARSLDLYSPQISGGRRLELRFRADGLSATLPRGEIREASLRGALAIDSGAWTLRRVVIEGRTPWGPVRATGEASGAAGRWVARGRIGSPGLAFGEWALADPAARFEAGPGLIRVPEAGARFLGGSLEASGIASLTEGGWIADVTGRLAGAGFRGLPGQSAAAPLAALFRGANLDFRGRVPLRDPARAEGEFDLAVLPAGGLLPWKDRGPAGRLRGRLASGSATIEEGWLEAEGVRADLSGSVALRGALDLGVSAEAPRIAPILERLGEGVARLHPLRDGGLDGRLALRGRVEGTVREPVLRVGLSVAGPSFRAFRADLLEARLRLDAAGVEILEARSSGGNAEILASGRASWRAGQALEIEGEVVRLDLGALLRSLGVDAPAEAALDGRLMLRSRSGTPWIEGSARASELAWGARRPGGILRAAGSLALDGTASSLRIAGEGLSLGALAGIDGLGGTLSFEGPVGGPLSRLRPGEGASFGVDAIAWGVLGPWDLAGEVAAEGEDWVVRALCGDPDARLVLRFDPGATGSLRGSLESRGFELALPAGGEETPLRVRAGPLRASFEGPAARPGEGEGTATLDGLFLSGEGWELASQAGLSARLAEGRIALAPASFALDRHRFILEGEATPGPSLRWSLRARGTADLRALEAFVAPARLGGTAEADLELRGAGRAWESSGTLRVSGGYLRVPGLPESMESIEAVLELRPDRLTISDLEGRMGGGRLRARGYAERENLRWMRYRVALSGTGVWFREPEVYEALTDFDLTLSGDRGEARMTGGVEIVRGRYTQDLRIESSMLSRSVRRPRARPLGRGQALSLDVSVNGEGGFWMDNDFAQVEVRPSLRVTGTLANPLLVGSVDSTQPGLARFQRVEYQLNACSLSWGRGHPNDPELDAAASTRVSEHEILLDVSGRLSSPVVSLSSIPDLPREEILSLLLLGTPGASSAGGPLAGGMTGRYGNMGGAGPSRPLDIFQILPILGDEAADAAARVTVGQRLGGKVSAFYSFPVGETEGAVVGLRYRPSRSFVWTHAQELEGSYSTDFLYLRTFHMGRKPGESGPAGGETIMTASVWVTGAPEPPGEEAVRGRLGLREGRPFVLRELYAAEENSRQALAEAGWPLASVRCGFPPVLPDLPVPVICGIEPGPPVVLEIAGVGKKHQAALRQAVGAAWAEIAFPEELEPQAVAAVERWHRDRGHARVRVVATGDEQGPLRRIRLEVEPGEIYRVGAVEVAGNEAVGDDEAMTVLGSPRRQFLWRKRLLPGILEQDRRSLEGLYAEKGFLDVGVDPPAVEYPPARGKPSVTFRVREGEEHRLAAVSFSGFAVFTEEDLRARFPIGEGGVVSTEALDIFAFSLEGEYDRRGYPDAAVLWSLRGLPGDRGLDQIEVRIEEGPRVAFGAVEIAGHAPIRREIVEREVRFRRGDPFSRAALAETQRRILKTGLFRTVSLEGRMGPDPAVRDVVIRVRLRDNTDLSTGIGWDQEEGFRGSFSWALRGVGGRNVTLGTLLQLGGEEQHAQVSSTFRRVGGGESDLFGSLGYLRNDRPGYVVEETSATARLSRPLRADTNLGAFVQWKDQSLPTIRVSDDAPGLEPGRYVGLGASVVRDRRDSVIRPTRGGLEALNLSAFQGVGGDGSGWFTVSAQGSRYFRVGKRAVYGISGRAGIHAPWSGEIPLAERFYAGGASSMRGFERDFLGPLDPATGEPLGGEALLLVNQELSMPIGESWSAFLFADVGNVYPEWDDLLSGDLRYTAGTGIAIETPVGPLRFLYGWKLDRRSGESPGEFHFSVGTNF